MIIISRQVKIEKMAVDLKPKNITKKNPERYGQLGHDKKGMV
jgi:hypothetical protein